jgi:hypothetical protein
MGSFAAETDKAQLTQEEIYISKAENFERPVTLPPDVVKVLIEFIATDPYFGAYVKRLRMHPDRLFFATDAHLGNPNEVDFIVGGIAPLCAADGGFFWVVRSTPKKPKVILSAAGNYIEVLDTRTHGYRDIRTIWPGQWQTRDDVYHFNGNEYKLRKEKWVENRP